LSVHHRLMAPVVAKGLFAVEAGTLDHGKIVEREKAGVLATRGIAVLVPGPGRHTKDAALLPVEALAAPELSAVAQEQPRPHATF
jgi:hypothetical protein